MESYEKTIKVSKKDLDDLDHVNNVRYVQWIQDISKEHWQTVAPKEMQAGILKKHTIDYLSSAVLGDEILARTYIADSKGAISVRCVEMYHKTTHVLLVRSLTEWCLLNALTLRPIRISEAIKEIFISK